MIRHALILGARPVLTKGRAFPRVPLGPGGWRIDVENRQTSKIRLTIEAHVNGTQGGTATVPRIVEINDDSSPLLVQGPVAIYAEIYEAGREEFINVRASKVS